MKLSVQDCVCKIVCARLSVQDCLCKIVREIFQARLSVEVVCEEEEDWVKLSSKRCPVGLEDLQVGLLSVWAGQSWLVQCLGRAESACSVSGPGRVAAQDKSGIVRIVQLSFEDEAMYCN